MMQKPLSYPSATFEEIFEAFRSKVYRICLGYVGNADLAEDLCQEVFVIVWKKLKGFRGDSAIGTWIFRITVNQCLGHLRKEKSKTTVPLEEWHSFEAPPQETTQTERLSLLSHFIQELKEVDRLTLSLLLEEVPYPEIAQILGVKEGALRVRIHRIKEKLAVKFKDYGKSSIA